MQNIHQTLPWDNKSLKIFTRDIWTLQTVGGGDQAKALNPSGKESIFLNQMSASITPDSILRALCVLSHLDLTTVLYHGIHYHLHFINEEHGSESPT